MGCSHIKRLALFCNPGLSTATEFRDIDVTVLLVLVGARYRRVGGEGTLGGTGRGSGVGGVGVG